MKRTRQILLKILFPHIALVIALACISAAMLIYSLGFDHANNMIQYISYFLSAYSLTIICARMPAVFGRVRRVKRENKYLSKYFDSAALRVKVSLYYSLALNIGYAAMQLWLGIYNHSIWFYALSVYYALLAFMRFFLLRGTQRGRRKTDLHLEYLSCRFCGMMLLLLNIALSVIVFYMVNQNRGFSYHYIVTIAMAAYTFFTFTTAVVNLIRYTRYGSPVISASKGINLAAALVSMLALETAMLNAFGQENSTMFRKAMTARTGAAVCILILSMAIYMIVHSTRKLHEMEKEAKET